MNSALNLNFSASMKPTSGTIMFQRAYKYIINVLSFTTNNLHMHKPVNKKIMNTSTRYKFVTRSDIWKPLAMSFILIIDLA